MIKVLIENLQLCTIIGLLKHERVNEQKVVINASFVADEFIDYAQSCSFIEEEFKTKKFYKVEDSLEYFQEEFKKKFITLKYFYMKVIKSEIISNAHVGAEIEKHY